MATKELRRAEVLLFEPDCRLGYSLSQKEADGRVLYSLFLWEEFGQEREEVCLDDFTDGEEEAYEIFRLFVSGEVTVSSAGDLLEDLLYTP